VSDLYIPGRTFPVKQYFLEDLMEVRAAAAAAAAAAAEEAAAAAAAEEAAAASEKDADTSVDGTEGQGAGQSAAEEPAAGDQVPDSTPAADDTAEEGAGEGSTSETGVEAVSSDSDSFKRPSLADVTLDWSEEWVREVRERITQRMPPEGSAVAFDHKSEEMRNLAPAARQRLLGYEVRPSPRVFTGAVLLRVACVCGVCLQQSGCDHSSSSRRQLQGTDLGLVS
jgi:hypothetical protein